MDFQILKFSPFGYKTLKPEINLEPKINKLYQDETC